MDGIPVEKTVAPAHPLIHPVFFHSTTDPVS